MSRNSFHATRVLARGHRIWMLAWLIPLAALVIGAPAEYRATYPTLASRRVLVAQMHSNTMTTALYGPLHYPGTLGQLTQWETGQLAICLGAIAATVLGVRLARSDEESGIIEVIRAVGPSRHDVWRSTLFITTSLSAILGIIVGAGLLAQRNLLPELPARGAVNLGMTIALSVCAMAFLGLLIAQICPDAATAHRASLTLITGLFAIRAIADTQHIAWLNWLSPLGWREVTQPFTHNLWWPLAIFAVTDVALAATATAAQHRRPYLAGLVQHRTSRSRSIQVSSPRSLVFHVEHSSLIAWGVAILVASTTFGAMTHTIKSVLTDDATTRGLMTHLTGIDNPVASYLQYLSTIIGILMCVFSITLITRARIREAQGLAQWEICAGQSRTSPLMAAVFASAISSLLFLTASAAIIGGLAGEQVSGVHAFPRAFIYILGQWPACLVCSALAAFLMARWPHQTSAAYAVVAMSAAVTIFAGLLHLPRWMANLSVLGHAPDVIHATPSDWTGLAMMTVGALALIAISRRIKDGRDVAE